MAHNFTSPSTGLPAHQGGARRPSRAPPSPAAAVAARWYDWVGLVGRAANDGCWIRHDPEPRRTPVRQGACRPHALDGDCDGRCSDHSRLVPAAQSRVSRRTSASCGSRRRVFGVIYPDFPLDLTGLFPGKHLIQFLANKMHDFRNFPLPKCILNFDPEQVYLKLQLTNVKNKEVTANPKEGLNPKP